MMFYIKLIIKLDKTDKIRANSDFQGHNGTEITYKFTLLLPFKSCIDGMKLAVGGANKTRS